FFSSRRRHTRFSRDWSSDVCSSDLAHVDAVYGGSHLALPGGGPARGGLSPCRGAGGRRGLDRGRGRRRAAGGRRGLLRRRAGGRTGRRGGSPAGCLVRRLGGRG